MPLLTVEDLSVRFQTSRGKLRAVDGVSWSIEPGKTLALVGESGCGKSVTALSIMGLIPQPPGQIAASTIALTTGGQTVDLSRLSQRQLQTIRGKQISMIFQEPMTSLNPVYTVGDQIVEAILLHTPLRGKQAWDRAVEMLERVGIPSPAMRVRDYPHQLSGGMRQRIMIAMALACEPALLIADEPTTALDVTIQAQILDLLRNLQQRSGMSILMITHDLGVVAEIAHDVAVMYAGKIVEQASVEQIFAQPRHPYTAGLLKSIPRMGERRKRLDVIPGSVIAMDQLPRGCRFQPRCELGLNDQRCSEEEPELETAPASPTHLARCWKSALVLPPPPRQHAPAGHQTTLAGGPTPS